MALLELLYWFVPPGGEVLLIALAGLFLMLGIASRARVKSFLVGLVLFLLLEPFIVGFVLSLPYPLQLLVTAGFYLLLFAAVGRLLFGKRVMTGLKVRILWALITAPFRLLGWCIRGCLRLLIGPRRRELVHVERPARRPPQPGPPFDDPWDREGW